MRQHKRTPSQHREVKVHALLPSSHPSPTSLLLRSVLLSWYTLLTAHPTRSGNPQRAIQLHERRHRWSITPAHQPVYHLGRDRTWFLWRCPPRRGPVRSRICTLTSCWWKGPSRTLERKRNTYATISGRQRILKDPLAQTRPVQHPAPRSPAPTSLPPGRRAPRRAGHGLVGIEPAV